MPITITQLKGNIKTTTKTGFHLGNSAAEYLQQIFEFTGKIIVYGIRLYNTALVAKPVFPISQPGGNHQLILVANKNSFVELVSMANSGIVGLNFAAVGHILDAPGNNILLSNPGAIALPNVVSSTARDTGQFLLANNGLPHVYIGLKVALVVTITYSALAGGNFAPGNNIGCAPSGATLYCLFDDGVGTMRAQYVENTPIPPALVGDTMANGFGVTATIDTITIDTLDATYDVEIDWAPSSIAGNVIPA